MAKNGRFDVKPGTFRVQVSRRKQADLDRNNLGAESALNRVLPGSESAGESRLTETETTCTFSETNRGPGGPRELSSFFQKLVRFVILVTFHHSHMRQL